MEINFNNPLILGGYLEQAKPQYGLENVDGIVVGKVGGLAYHLFTDCGKELSREFQIKSHDSIKNGRKYFDELEAFLDRNEERAIAYGFQLVTIRPSDNSIFIGPKSLPYIYYTGIGDTNIESIEKFEKFLEMVKTYCKTIQAENEKLKEILSPNIIMMMSEELNFSEALTLK